MNNFKMLVLTDHSKHNKENSIYALLKELKDHFFCKHIDVASRGNAENNAFFNNLSNNKISVSRVNDQFGFREDGSCFTKNLMLAKLSDYDVILMRLPHPVRNDFLRFLKNSFPEKAIINRPSGIVETSNKTFILNFPEFIPPSRLINSIQDIEAFKSQYPIVLKPLRSYGGKGIVKIDNETVWEGEDEISFSDFKTKLKGRSIEYLGMKYLKNVHAGDKRIIVCNKKILGASLRLPARNSWLCNVAQGGSSHMTNPNSEEKAMAYRLNEVLFEKGIILFGFDTLLGDEGVRKLSEINTLSIGGLPQTGILSQKPVVKTAASLIWEYIKKEVYGNSEIIV
jgi:glutathione synthase